MVVLKLIVSWILFFVVLAGIFHFLSLSLWWLLWIFLILVGGIGLLIVSALVKSRVEYRARNERPTSVPIEYEVASEVRLLLNTSLKECSAQAQANAVAELNCDRMSWFVVRPRRYGESGSYYGVAEVNVASPWPKWLKYIPTDQIKNVQIGAYRLSENRKPLGGHMMDEENRRRAVCEFAGQVIFTLLDMEQKKRECAI